MQLTALFSQRHNRTCLLCLEPKDGICIALKGYTQGPKSKTFRRYFFWVYHRASTCLNIPWKNKHHFTNHDSITGFTPIKFNLQIYKDDALWAFLRTMQCPISHNPEIIRYIRWLKLASQSLKMFANKNNNSHTRMDAKVKVSPVGLQSK